MASPILGRKPGRRSERPRATLAMLFVIVLALLGAVAASVQFAKPAGQWTPKLGLDLEGGRQITLEPVIGNNQSVSSGQVDQAVNIIRQRVDSTGVAEAEVTTLGERNIVVSIPGEPSEEMLESLSRSSQLTIRPVISATPDQPAQITLPQPPTVTPSANSSANPSAPAASPSAPAATSSAPAASPSAAATSTAARNGVYPKAHASNAGTSSLVTARPDNPSSTEWAAQPVSQNWISAGIVDKGATYQDLVTAFSCSSTEHREVAGSSPANQPTVMCEEGGQNKYLLGPVEVQGSMISDASSGPETNQQGVQTGGTMVNLKFDSAGTKAFGDMTKRLLAFGQGNPQNQSAIVLDGQVLSAPTTQSAITNGEAQITGGFTAATGSTLADQLKFGALPFSFKELTNDQISPQLGSDQLQKGLLAGLIGFVLVVIYSLLQYRMLGLVTVASLVIAGVITYLTVTLLGELMNFRLTMAGVTGLIVAIGVTADSFIVYFERVRDEVRSGRPLRAAVETGWARARRTIIISDVVNFLAATILYVLSESNVKAFAFTLGLTTIFDLLIVMMFTHPALTLLARTKFFGGGHPWSGLDPERLGAKTATYAGRGRVTIADRRAASSEGSA